MIDEDPSERIFYCTRRILQKDVFILPAVTHLPGTVTVLWVTACSLLQIAVRLCCLISYLELASLPSFGDLLELLLKMEQWSLVFPKPKICNKCQCCFDRSHRLVLYNRIK